MNYSQEQFNNAILITSAEYCNLLNPIFEGQTRASSDTEEYKMFFSCDNKLYYTINKL
jgi:hypothetical protein